MTRAALFQGAITHITPYGRLAHAEAWHLQYANERNIRRLHFISETVSLTASLCHVGESDWAWCDSLHEAWD